MAENMFSLCSHRLWQDFNESSALKLTMSEACPFRLEWASPSQITAECFLQALLRKDMWVRHTHWLITAQSFAEWVSLWPQVICTIVGIFLLSVHHVLSSNTSHNNTHVTFWGRRKFTPKLQRQHLEYLWAHDRRKIQTEESLLNPFLCFFFIDTI